MICLDDVTDRPLVLGKERSLLSRVNLDLAQGRYALCSASPDSRRFVIDVVAGVRPPSHGRVTHHGLVSWPLGRQGFVRGKATGLRTARFLCALYGLDASMAIDTVSDLLSHPDVLQQPMEDWSVAARLEFTFAMGLLPDFDVYIIDGSLPADTSRFGRLWRGLFEERLIGRTLILSSYRRDQILDYCVKALVLNDEDLRIDDDLELQLQRFPPGPVRSGDIAADGDAVSDESTGEQLGL